MSSVVVVGGGLAGLGCAWRLQRAGFDVEVLDASEQPGGRLRTQDIDGFLIEPGTGFFTSNDRSLHSVTKRLGLADSVQSVLRYPDAVLHASGISALRPVDDPFLLRSNAISKSMSARLLRLRFEWVRWRGQLAQAPPNSPHAQILSDGVARLEAESLAVYLDRIVGVKVRRSILAPIACSALGLDAENLSAAYLLTLLNRVSGARPQYLAGGMGQLATAIAKRVPVRSRCEVTSLETQSDGARVRYRVGDREGSVVADSVVVALPGSRVADVCPKITPSERGFFESVRYARSIDVHLLLNNDVSLPFRTVSFPRRKGLELYGVQAAHHKRGAAPAGASLLRTSLCETECERLWRGTDAKVAAKVLADLASTPIGKLDPDRVVVHRSSESAPVFYPGYLAKLGRFTSRTDRTPRLAFCGDYLVGNGVESSLMSGMRAASHVAHGLG